MTVLSSLYTGQLEYKSFFDFFESTSYEDDESNDSEREDGADSDGSDAVTSSKGNMPHRRGRSRTREGRYYDEEEGSDDGSAEEINRGSSDGSEDEEDDEEEQSALDCEFELGEEFKDEIIRYAIHWYTGGPLTLRTRMRTRTTEDGE